MSMYARPLEEVQEVKETTDIAEVNRLVRSGWMLISVITPCSKRPETKLFSLGKLPTFVNVTD